MGFYQEDFIKHEKKHKYIAKIKMPSGYTRYFYGQSELDAYLDSEIEETSRGKQVWDSKTGRYKILKDDEVEEFNRLKEIRDRQKENANNLYKSLGIESVANYLNASNSKETDAQGHKYIAKVKTSKGYTRYFYDQAEWQAYCNREKYQKEEPGFMEDVPEQDDWLSVEEEAKAVNPKIGESEYSINCTLCSFTYELRRRGYDVTAGKMDQKAYDTLDGIGDPKKFLSNLYEDPKVKNVDGYEDLINKLKSEPGTRGNLNYVWKGRKSGHSIVYETDSKGDVKIIDGQTGSIYYSKEDVKNLISRTEQLTYTRTDNLKIKKGGKEVGFESKSKR